MKRVLRGFTSIEAMVMTVAISMVFIVSYSAQASSMYSYRQIINRERAMLFAAETLEQLEAMKLTKIQKNYAGSWYDFLGRFGNGEYTISTDLKKIASVDLLLVETPHEASREETASLCNGGSSSKLRAPAFPDDSSSVRLYDQDRDFYTRLERRIFICTTSDKKRAVTVSVYYGLLEQYSQQNFSQVRLQAVYADHVQSGISL